MVRLLAVLVLAGASARAGLGDTEDQFIAKYGMPSAPYSEGVTRLPVEGGPVNQNSNDPKNFISIYKQGTNEVTVWYKDGKVEAVILEKKVGTINDDEFKSFRDKYASGARFTRDTSVPKGIDKEKDKIEYLNAIVVFRDTQADQTAVWFKTINKISVRNGELDPVVMKASQP